MASPELVLSVDIGGDSIKLAEFMYPDDGGRMVLQRFAFAEYGGDPREEGQQLDSLFDAFSSALSESDFKAKKVNLSVSGQSAFVRFVKLPPVGEEEERVKQIVEYEAKQNVPFPMDEVVWDYQLISGSDDESEIEVMFVVIKNDVIEGITDIVEQMGMQVALVEVAPTACYNSARANEIGGDECVMILNIGGRCSSLVFIDSGRFFVRTIPIAGHSITQQIAKEFGIPFADAEEMKRRHGFVALGGAYEEPDSEVAATVSKIVRNVMTRLHGEINRSINVYRAQQKGQKPTKLYLAGGSSVMAFTPRFFSEKLRIPVEYFNPFQVVSLSQEIDKENLAEVAHMFSEVIGLGLRKATVCPIEISLVPEGLKKQYEFKQKVPYFLISAVSLVLCLVITYFGFNRLASLNKDKAKVSAEELKKTKNIGGKVGKASSSMEENKSQFDNAEKILAKRFNWVKLLNELQRQLPPNTWLIDIKGSDTSGKKAAPTTVAPTAPGSMFGGPAMFGGGGGGHRAKPAPVASKKILWVAVKGYYLMDKDKTQLEQQFKKNLLNSGYFSSSKDEVSINSFNPTTADKNIAYFEMDIKLKEEINK